MGRIGSAQEGGMYTTHDPPAKQKHTSELPAIGVRNIATIPHSKQGFDVKNSTELKQNYDNMIKIASAKKQPIHRNNQRDPNTIGDGRVLSRSNMARHHDINKFSKVQGVYPTGDSNMRDVHKRQPKLNAQSPYLIIPKGMGNTVIKDGTVLPGINKLVSSVEKPLSK